VWVPAPLELGCGDAFAVVESPLTWTFLVADGLGHGPLAADAAARAVDVLHAAGAGADPARVLQRAHEALRGGRGAAIGVGVVTRATGAIRYAGIGNVSARVVTRDRGRSLVSLNGTVGVQMPSPKEFDCVWPAGGVLVVHSDGIDTRWDLGRDPTLAARDPAVVAGALYRDHARGNDDVTVLVGRRRPAAGNA
jgi:hypothetical protein